jgi:hypothetical protein
MIIILVQSGCQWAIPRLEHPQRVQRHSELTFSMDLSGRRSKPRELTCHPLPCCHVSRVVAVNENTVPEAVAASNNEAQTPLDVASSQECRAILTRASQVTSL